MCGGVPWSASPLFMSDEFSPHVWGCSDLSLSFARSRCFPHMCGGVPTEVKTGSIPHNSGVEPF